MKRIKVAALDGPSSTVQRAPRFNPALRREARALYHATQAFIRFYQFRDRNRAVKHGLTVIQCYVLDCLLQYRSLSLNDLAEHLRLDKSTVSRVIDTMVRRGFARRVRDRVDKRMVVLTHTADGRRRFERVVAHIVAQNCELLTAYPSPIRHQLVFLIRSLTRLGIERDAKANS